MAATIDAILFDKDGTMIDYQATWAPINLKAGTLAARGDTALAAKLVEAGGADARTGHARADAPFAAGSARDIARALIAQGALWNDDDLTRALDMLFLESVARAVPVCDLDVLFTRLRADGVRIGIASSDNEASIRALLAHLRIAQHVDFVAGYDSGHGTKPGPGMVLAFARCLAVDPRAIAVVGDNAHDLHMGRSAGAGLIVGVLTGTGTRATLSGADRILKSIADLPRLFFDGSRENR